MQTAIKMTRDALMNFARRENTDGATGRSHAHKASVRAPELNNIVKTAIRIISGSEAGEVARAARIIGVSEPTLYRWRRAGNMREARGGEVLRVNELTGLPVELLLRG